MYLISACLCGVNCKYNGGNNENQLCSDLYNKGKAILVCPEVLGGLSTPRVPAELINSAKKVLEGNGQILSREGSDVTAEFILGAQITLEIAKLNNIKTAILKDGSPSCGLTYVYDGTFSGNRVNGIGVTTQLLLDNNIKIYSELTVEGEIKDV